MLVKIKAITIRNKICDERGRIQFKYVLLFRSENYQPMYFPKYCCAMLPLIVAAWQKNMSYKHLEVLGIGNVSDINRMR
jgi:hypothetical protein